MSDNLVGRVVHVVLVTKYEHGAERSLPVAAFNDAGSAHRLVERCQAGPGTRTGVLGNRRTVFTAFACPLIDGGTEGGAAVVDALVESVGRRAISLGGDFGREG